MKVELFNFQKKAVENLRDRAVDAHLNYERSHTPQIISFTAPTGSGKTVIMADFIEEVFFGNEGCAEQPDAIFVWLSDSPQLNEQSKMKFDLLADRINLTQCKIIEDSSFDQETFEEGNIYFLNTQKIGASGNLAKHSDNRQYTIWETFQNTIELKSEKLYLIIDEAHRGMNGRDAAKATSIMQKFIKGSPNDGLSPLPVVIGMSATSERFNRLVENTTSTIHYVIVSVEDVRSSGLLKDRIIVQYPGNTESNNEMAILQAATDEWQNKCKHWYQYTYEQHYANVSPIFVIQVQKGSGNNISDTNLGDCLEKIEERCGQRFKEGEVVHSFGDFGEIEINGLKVPHINASDINDNRLVKIVFFKESLTTGWDCPRAETMMSFRKAVDSTYIAQLLGRMIRTPLGMRVRVDESLNDVHLYLPYYDGNTVESVLISLKNSEGGEIPAYIESESLDTPRYISGTIRPQTHRGRNVPVAPGQTSIFDLYESNEQNNDVDNNVEFNSLFISDNNDTQNSYRNQSDNADRTESIDIEGELQNYRNIDRPAIVRYVNSSGFSTYEVKNVQINDYLESLFKIGRFITHTGLETECIGNIKKEISEKIHEYVTYLHSINRYESLADKVLEFKLLSKTYDTFGERIYTNTNSTLFHSDTDLDRQLRNAEIRLKGEGISTYYGQHYFNEDDPNSFKIDVILFVAAEENMRKLTQYAKIKFHELDDSYRRSVTRLTEAYIKKYHDIVADADEVSIHNYLLPEEVALRIEENGDKYYDHLYVGKDSCYAFIKLNDWEKEVIKHEQQKDDYICFLRNPSRGNYGLCVKYEINGQKKGMYPDFLVFRKENDSYVMDILEPHGSQFADSLAKAKGLAEYAHENPAIGKVQMIRMDTDIDGAKKLKRLDLQRGLIQEKVKNAISIDDFNNIFDTDGIFD